MKNTALIWLLVTGLLLRLGTSPAAAQVAPAGPPAPTTVVLRSCRPENPPYPGPALASATVWQAPTAVRLGTTPEVRIIYLVPSDRTINPAYGLALTNAAHHLQRWYQQQLGNTKTFVLHSPIVETYQTTHSVAWYQTNANGAGTFSQFYINAANDAFAAAGGGSFNNPNYTYAIYIDAESACGQCGGCGGSGVLVVTSNDLKGLVGQPSIRFCPTDPAPSQYPPCRWVGGLGHELGHAFGLPHPPGCDQGLTTCDYNALMWVGYAAYPNTFLRPDDQVTLNASLFLRTQPPAATPATCNNLLPTRDAATDAELTASPNPSAMGTPLTLTVPIGSGPLTVAATDVVGRQLFRRSFSGNSGSFRIDAATFGNFRGVLLLTVQTARGTSTRRLLRE